MFRNVKRVELVMIPLLVTCVIPSAFKCVEDVKMENAGKFESVKELKEAIERKREEEERLRREEEERKRRAAEEERRRKEREEAERRRKEAEEAARRTAVISCKRDWDCVDKRVGVVEVSDGCCNEEGLKELDLRGFVNLRELKVGNECFENVKEVKLIGMSELKSVVVGKNSFVASSGAFSLQNCNSLTELVIGDSSFGNYHGIVLDNLPVLERVVMDDGCFVASSLELRGLIGHISSCKELPALKTLSFGRESFRNCNRVVFESNEYKGK